MLSDRSSAPTLLGCRPSAKVIIAKTYVSIERPYLSCLFVYCITVTSGAHNLTMSHPSLGLFLIGSSRVLTTAPAGTGLCSLRRILSVWTSSWKKPNSTEAPKGHPLVAAPRTTTMRRNAGKSETLPLSTAAGQILPSHYFFVAVN